MSDYVNNNLQFAAFDPNEDLGAVNWDAELQEIMQEPWLESLDFFDWDAYATQDQGADAMLPESRWQPTMVLSPEQTCNDSLHVVPTHQPSLGPLGVNTPPVQFVCKAEGCRAKPFKRSAEMRRHERQKHNTLPPQYPCTALGCNRNGNRAFHREDKRNDHMLSGHGPETLFKCPQPGCSKELTRDIMAIHHGGYSMIPNMIRTCPMPRCSFRVHRYGRNHRHMDDMLAHLQEKHDARGRLNYRTLLLERGYDASTGGVLCPICPSHSVVFATHLAFYYHFVVAHGQGIGSRLAQDLANAEPDSYLAWGCGFYNDTVSWVSEEIRQHRCVLLSLWPAVGNMDIWSDVKDCGS